MRAGLAAMLAVVVVAIAAPAASAAPWPCDGAGYVVQEDAVTTNGQVWFQRVDRQPNGTYALTRLGTFADTQSLNALGFRAQDGFMYGWAQDSSNVVRVEFDPITGEATLDPLGVPAGLPAGFGTVVGTFLNDGNYIVFGSDPVNGASALIIDVTTTPTPTVVSQLTPTAPLSGFADWAVSPVDGKLYAAMNAPSPGVYELVISGNQISQGSKIADASASGGAQWFSPYGEQGTLIVYRNNVDLIGIDLAANQESFLGDAPDVSGVDGASCASGIALTKDAQPRTVTAGTELTYTYRLTSRAPGTNPVNFVDQLPAGMTYVAGSVTVNPPFGTVNNYGGTSSLTISGALAQNSTATITARVRVAPDHACNANVDNQAQGTLSVPGLPAVTIDSDDPDTPNNPTDATRVQVNCAADVSIVKTAATSPIVPGEDATFNLVVTNNGPSTATNVNVSDQLPADFSFASASEGCAEAGGTLTCTVASLAPGASQTFTVTGGVPSSLDECLENTATVTSATPDPDSSNNASTVCAPIRGRSNVSITKAASSATVAIGGQVMYTLVVENDGPSDDPGVAVTDVLPAGLALVSASASQGTCTTTGNTVSCDLGALKDRGSAQVLVTANVTATSGCIPNTARVRASHVDPTPADNQASAQVCVEPPPDPRFDLSATKTLVTEGRIYVGQKVTYRIVVANKGPEAAPGVKMTDTLNAPATLVSVKTTAGSCNTSIPVTCSLGTIAAGDSVTITMRVRHRQAGTGQINAASVTGEGTDTVPEDNIDRVSKTVRKVTLKVTKVASSRSVAAGGVVRYAIRVKNTSKGLARRVTTCDRLPSGMAFVSSTPKAKRSAGRRCWTAKRLKAGKAKVYRVTVRVARGANGTKVNRATVKSRDVKNARATRAVRVLGQATPVTG